MPYLAITANLSNCVHKWHRIARGHGLQAAPETMGTAVTRAKSQLQQAFAKIGTQHQAGLAVLCTGHWRTFDIIDSAWGYYLDGGGID
jgi:adenylosuccinate lyase